MSAYNMIKFLPTRWELLITPAIVFVAVFLVGWFVRHLIFRALGRWARETSSSAAELAASTLRGPSLLWVAILALHLAAESSALPKAATTFSAEILLVLWFLSLTMVASKVAGNLVSLYAAKNTTLPVTSLTQNLTRLVVVSIGLLILLNTLGVSVTPILTALGVGGLAVALALQDTLSNLFAGFYVSMEGRQRIGDYIKLNTGEEGYIADIGWRTTTLRALSNNFIVVPNAKLAQAVVTNFSLPDKRMSLSMPVAVSYASDPELVERVLVEEALAAARDVPGLLSEPAPSVRLIPGFGESSLNFSLNFHVGEFVDQYLAQHELRKRILKRFRKEGLEIPFPTRTLLIKNGAGADAGRLQVEPEEGGG